MAKEVCDTCEGRNLQNVARRVSKDDVRKNTIYSRYPGIIGYAYNADNLSIEDGDKVMEHLISEAKSVTLDREGNYYLHMKNGKVINVQDSNDFPQPFSERVQD